MGILRTDKISGLETPTAVTGSVSFDGSGDSLSISTNTNFEFGGNVNFTIEFWINLSDNSRIVGSYSQTPFCIGGEQCRIYINGTDGLIGFKYRTTNRLTSFLLTENKWEHIALVRNNGVITFYLNGNADSNTLTNTGTNTIGNCVIGAFDASNGNILGYISNLRILKGTALYTENFTPPTRELQPIGDTVLLCCNNPDSAGAEATGKTITVNGNAAASTFSPGLVRDFTYGTQFDGVSRFDTQGYFVPPSGTTEQRSRGRGVLGGGSTPTYVNNIDYITISTLGNAQDFGDLLNTPFNAASLASSTRGIFAGGTTPTVVNTIQYITIATTSNSVDFGDLIETKWSASGCSSSTRGIVAGGRTPTFVNSIDYMTIATLGDTQNFGDLTQSKNEMGAASSPTRGIFMGGQPGSGRLDRIEFITIATTGDATTFGTLSADRNSGASVSNTTRALFAGGAIETPTIANSNTIEYITIASTGNAQDFGDLTVARYGQGGCSNSIRGTFSGGTIYGPDTQLNTIEYITIASTGNAQDFGDLITATTFKQGLSDSHGGLS